MVTIFAVWEFRKQGKDGWSAFCVKISASENLNDGDI